MLRKQPSIAGLIRVTGRVLETSSRAYKFQAADRTQWHWLPKSQCTWNPDEGVMYCADWIAKDKGYIA